MAVQVSPSLGSAFLPNLDNLEAAQAGADMLYALSTALALLGFAIGPVLGSVAVIVATGGISASQDLQRRISEEQDRRNRPTSTNVTPAPPVTAAPAPAPAGDSGGDKGDGGRRLRSLHWSSLQKSNSIPGPSFEIDVEFKGRLMRIGAFSAGSAKECQEICQASESCNFFTYLSTTNNCGVLSSKDFDTVAKSGAVSIIN